MFFHPCKFPGNDIQLEMTSIFDSWLMPPKKILIASHWYSSMPGGWSYRCKSHNAIQDMKKTVWPWADSHLEDTQTKILRQVHSQTFRTYRTEPVDFPVFFSGFCRFYVGQISGTSTTSGFGRLVLLVRMLRSETTQKSWCGKVMSCPSMVEWLIMVGSHQSYVKICINDIISYYIIHNI